MAIPIRREMAYLLTPFKTNLFHDSLYRSILRSLNINRVCVSALSTRATGQPQSNKAIKKSPTPPSPQNLDELQGRAATISRAMKAYLIRSTQHDEFMKEQTAEYEIGRRHLANMMGDDPETFNQDDIDKAIEYLLPSGLFEKKARPMMKHPEITFPKRKAAEFDMSGRPFHFLFYTGFPNYFEVLHEITAQVDKCNQYEDQMWGRGIRHPHEDLKLNLTGTAWMSKVEMEAVLLENISDQMYNQFITCMERLSSLTYASIVKDFIHKYRVNLVAVTHVMEILPMKYDENGRGYSEAKGRRDSAWANVIVREKGTGKIRINGDDIRYFERTQDREQVLFPLFFTDLHRSVDVEAEAWDGGFQSRAGAIRFGISMALRNFVSPEEVERMRLAGLLTNDPRIKERKKYGQEGARRKFTWKKR